MGALTRSCANFRGVNSPTVADFKLMATGSRNSAGVVCSMPLPQASAKFRANLVTKRENLSFKWHLTRDLGTKREILLGNSIRTLGRLSRQKSPM